MSIGSNLSLARRLVAALSTDPEAAGIAQYRRDGTLEWRSRAQLLRDSRAIADGLRASGLRSGEPAIIVPVIDGEIDAAALVCGCILAECPPLVLPALDGGLIGNPGLVQRAAQITECRAVLAGATDLSRIKATAALVKGSGTNADCLDLPGLRDRTARLDLQERANRVENCQALQLTSGTTGESRVCVWNGRSMQIAMAGVASCMALREGDRLFAWSGLHHTVGIFNHLLVGLFHGYPVIFMSPQYFAMDPGLWLSGLDASRATITSAPNFAFRLVADQVSEHRVRSLSLATVRAIWNTGERVLPSSMEAMRARLEGTELRPAALRANYGLAENIGGATFSATGTTPLLIEALNADDLEARRAARPWMEGARRIDVATVGAPWPGLTIVVRDEEGKPLPDGEVGEVALASPSRFEGYLNDQPATDAVMDGEFLLTGDLGYARNQQLFWIGRSKDAINVRGRKIDPDEFIPILEAIDGPNPSRYAAFGVVDLDRGTERVVLLIELADMEQTTRVMRELRRASATRLGIVPDEIIPLSPGTLNTTISGKRRHRYYRQLYESAGADALRGG